MPKLEEARWTIRKGDKARDALQADLAAREQVRTRPQDRLMLWPDLFAAPVCVGCCCCGCGRVDVSWQTLCATAHMLRTQNQGRPPVHAKLACMTQSMADSQFSSSCIQTFHLQGFQFFTGSEDHTIQDGARTELVTCIRCHKPASHFTVPPS